MNTKKVITYTVITLAIAWTIGIVISLFAVKNPTGLGKLVFQVGAMVMMYVPFLATLITNKTLKGIGWIPKFKGCAFLLPICFFGPQILTIIEGAVFFLIFPAYFDMSGSYLLAQGESMGVNLIEQLEAQGISVKIYYIITIAQAFIYAPLINMFLALGEEVGWRGFLYPELNKKFPRPVTWIIGGTIWSAFHFPLIIIAGYEYGMDYPGFPFVGLIVFTVFCIVAGIFEEIVYSKSKCIWYPAILHGAINATSFILLFINMNHPKTGSVLILGPALNGIIPLILSTILAIIVGSLVISKSKKEQA